MTLLLSVNIALMLAWTFCPDDPLYAQLRVKVASAPAASDPEIAKVLPPVQVTVAVPEIVSAPLSVTVEAPKLWMVNV